MTVPETVDWPMVAVAAFLGVSALVLIVQMFARPKRRPVGGRRRRVKPADEMTALKTERDVMRANHAVDIAMLERKLEDARERIQAQAAADLAAKAHERRAAEAQARIDALTRDLNRMREDVQRMAAERDAALAAAERRASAAFTSAGEAGAASVDETIDRLKTELSEATDRAARASHDAAAYREELETLKAARAELEADVAAQRNTISRLRNSSERSGAEGADEAAAALALLTEERDQARGALEEATERLAAVSAERDALAAADSSGAADHETLEALRQTLSEHEETIRALRAQLEQRQDAPDATAADSAPLQLQLAEVEAREAKANQSLSELAYELDAVRSRAAAAAKQEAAARADVERREAMLELRLQKIYHLEEQLRATDERLREALRRAERAEAQAEEAAQVNGAPIDVDGIDASRLSVLQEELVALRAENASLKADRAANEGGLSGLRDELDAMAAPHGDDGSTQRVLPSDEVAELKERLRELGARFLAEATPPQEPPELSLAERIRAFKAARISQSAAHGPATPKT